MTPRSALTDSILAASQSAEDIIPAQIAAFDRLEARVNGTQGGLLVIPIKEATKSSNLAIPIYFIAGPSLISALQFDLILPSGVLFQGVSVGPAAVLANKQVSSAPVVGNTRIILFGLNQTVLGDGTILAIDLSVSSEALTGFQSVSMSGIVASKPEGVQEICCGVSGGLRIT